jgi:hypothetical protein
MKRLVLLLLPTLAALFFAGCAGDDDPFPVHSSAAQNNDNPVAGAATPARGDSSAAWKW